MENDLMSIARRMDQYDMGYLSGYIISRKQANDSFSVVKAWAAIAEWLHVNPDATPDSLKAELPVIVFDSQDTENVTNMVERAQDLNLRSDAEIDEIARMLGASDASELQSHFARIFGAESAATLAKYFQKLREGQK